jgi:hypothetical protein
MKETNEKHSKQSKKSNLKSDLDDIKRRNYGSGHPARHSSSYSIHSGSMLHSLLSLFLCLFLFPARFLQLHHILSFLAS